LRKREGRPARSAQQGEDQWDKKRVKRGCNQGCIGCCGVGRTKGGTLSEVPSPVSGWQGGSAQAVCMQHCHVKCPAGQDVQKVPCCLVAWVAASTAVACGQPLPQLPHAGTRETHQLLLRHDGADSKPACSPSSPLPLPPARPPLLLLLYTPLLSAPLCSCWRSPVSRCWTPLARTAPPRSRSTTRWHPTRCPE
jgi:hypothetical protein